MYRIFDIDGTLTTTGDTPRQDLIDLVKADVQDHGAEIIIVSGRNISRLDDTKAWLEANAVPYVELHLSDFPEGAPAIDFKEYKAKQLLEAHPDEITRAVDNDADTRAMYEALGIKALSPEAYIAEQVGDDMAEDDAEDMPEDEAGDEPAEAASNGRAAQGEHEIRTARLGAFEVRATEDGQRIVSGYAALFNSPSEGLPFTEVIAPGAFKRTLSRAKRGEAVVKFLHGHDEARMLATTASGRLTLQEDAQGLRVEAKLDPANPEAAAVISNLTHEAKAMGWSFGFTIPNGSGDKWNGNERTLKEIRLHEVSILSGSTPAYPATIGMAAVRKIAAPRLGVEAEALVDTLEAVRAGKDLTAEQTTMVDTIKSKLGAKPTAIHNSVADAQLRLARMIAEDI